VKGGADGVAAVPLDCVEDALGTFPLCAFHILGKGCSSQECGIFLWKTVEKVQAEGMWRISSTRFRRFAAAGVSQG
jgi:hypothetical protein